MRPTDEVAFSEFMAARWGSLYRTAYLLTGDRHEAEDLLQTALANTYVAWPRIRAREAVDAYVRRAMVNQAGRVWRKRNRATLTDDVPDPGHDGGLAGYAESATLWRAVTELPPRMRAVLVLRYYEDLTEAETAATLGCSVGAVKSQSHHALKRLRSVIGGTLHDFEEIR